MDADADGAATVGLSSGTFRGPSLPVVVVAGLVALVGVAMTFVGAGQTGLSADEYAHVKRLQSFYEDGLFVRNWERTTPEGTVPPNAYVYAPGTARVMHAVNQFAGHEGSGEVSTTAEAFIVRHYVVASMALAGTLAVFGLAWMALGTWRWAVVATGVLAAIPMWTGHAMFNPKDTPVAVGNTLMTLGLAGMALMAGERNRARLGVLAAYCVSLILGTTLMLGTRPGMWPGLAAAIVVVLLILAVGRRLDRGVLTALAAGLLGSYAALWQLYPKIFSHPIAMLSASVGQSTRFPHGVSSGRGYVFERTAIEWPVILLGFLVGGTVFAAVFSVRSMKSEPRQAAIFALVGVQAFALMAAAVITNANLYDGLRQMLFAVPAQAVLATVGIAAVASWVRPGMMRWVFSGVVVAALVLPMAVQARLYPYQYAYGNVVAERVGADILNDNWKVSFREWVEEIPPTVKAICPNKPPAGPPIKVEDFSDCRNSSGPALRPHWMAYWHHARFDPDSPKFYTVLRAQRPVPPNCRVLDEVVRKRNFERVVMSKLLLCTQAGAA